MRRSLGLLAYVGVGEARRTYPKLEVEKLAALVDVARQTLDTFLLAGGRPWPDSPASPRSPSPCSTSTSPGCLLRYRRRRQNRLRQQPGAQTAGAPDPTAGPYAASSLQDSRAPYQVGESDTYYQVTLPLHSKFEAAGDLHVVLPRAIVNDRINAAFAPVPIAALLLLLLYAIGVLWMSSRPGGAGTRWLTATYSVTFLLMALITIGTLLALYTAGIQGKTEALANSLSCCLNAPLELGPEPRRLTGLDQTLKDYQQLNPDLSFVALTLDDKVILHTDPAQVGSTWHTAMHPPLAEQVLANQLTTNIALESTAGHGALAVHLGVPVTVVFSQLWRTGKNFAALFLATALLSSLFFNLIRTFSRDRDGVGPHLSPSARALSLLGRSTFSVSSPTP